MIRSRKRHLPNPRSGWWLCRRSPCYLTGEVVRIEPEMCKNCLHIARKRGLEITECTRDADVLGVPYEED